MRHIGKGSILLAVALALAGCSDDPGTTTHGAGQDSTTFGDINVDDGATLIIESHTTAQAAVPESGEGEEEDLINGCSVESEAEGSCSRE